MGEENEVALDTLERRLANIERRVYGQSNLSARDAEDSASEVKYNITPAQVIK